MADSRLGAQLGAGIQSSLAAAADYLALITRSNPRGSAGALLARPDVRAVIAQALEEAQQNAEAAVDQAWWLAGGTDGPLYSRLAGDIGRIFGDLAHLHGLVRRAHASVARRGFTPGVDTPGTNPDLEAAQDRAEAVRQALLGWGRQAALRARMTLSTASGLGATVSALDEARDAEAAGGSVRKRWHRNPASRSCIWCRRLDGVTIGVRESFVPYLGGPAVLPHSAARRVATPAGERRFGLPAGSPIVYTRPPQPYHGDLQGPLLHPFCECRLEIVHTPGGRAVPSSSGQEGPAGPWSPAPQTTGGFLAASDIRDMPEEAYRSNLAFLRAALAELDRSLRRLAGG
jgi:hypothetical protein